MDYKKFFDVIRPKLKITNSNIPGYELIIKEGLRRGVSLWKLAYILATTYHETAATMKPIEEYGKGKGKKYGTPTGPYLKTYYGRGYVQLTWLFNYELASKKLGVDFVRYPEKVMEPDHAVKILFQGMEDGWFTGKSLKDYIDDIDESDEEDGREFTNARRIVNGTDKQKEIADKALLFEKALKAGGYGQKPTQTPVQTVEDAPSTSPWANSNPTVWSSLVIIFKLLFGGKK